MKMAITLRRITEDDLEMIMNWRMSDSVTRYMNTDPKLTFEGQRKWLKSVNEDCSIRYWLVEVDDTPVGVINLTDIDWENGSTSWGYYIGEERRRSLKLAIALEMSLYDYCFDILRLNEVHNEVFKLNEGVWKLHVACGCRITKDVQGEIEKNGIRYDIIHLSMDRDRWEEIRHNKKYEKVNFETTYSGLCDQDAKKAPFFLSGGAIPHHLGVAVTDIEQSIREYGRWGWIIDGQIIDDKERDVRLAFLKNVFSDDVIELVSPINTEAPVSNTLRMMKNVSTPYHICYEVDDIEKMITILKGYRYVLTEKANPACAFSSRKVAFMLNKDVGLIELLEKERRES